MAFKGKKKTDYQRRYMRERRAKLKVGLLDPLVRPELDADGNPTPDYDQIIRQRYGYN